MNRFTPDICLVLAGILEYARRDVAHRGVCADCSLHTLGFAAIGGAFIAEAPILGWRIARYSCTAGPIFTRESLEVAGSGTPQ